MLSLFKGEDENRNTWKLGKIVRLITGKDGEWKTGATVATNLPFGTSLRPRDCRTGNSTTQSAGPKGKRQRMQQRKSKCSLRKSIGHLGDSDRLDKEIGAFRAFQRGGGGGTGGNFPCKIKKK